MKKILMYIISLTTFVSAVNTSYSVDYLSEYDDAYVAVGVDEFINTSTLFTPDNYPSVIKNEYHSIFDNHASCNIKWIENAYDGNIAYHRQGWRVIRRLTCPICQRSLPCGRIRPRR